ncbi:MAG: YkgJ family cysteine cluster protein [Dehalogenimonas sp.]|uniref:YkgJ family cysteine cluster protein n=1 Tax=Candidatus Dehalogenimonas loeffleri TaxID=3127115 RepID=A0ABZ2J1P6_9CHLR|nr:YkgJ family cysteine cluster protein [Dehalogenimonas sp.]
MTVQSSEITCFCCGVCCAKYQVQMPLAEAQAIATRLGLTWEEFERDYLDPAWPGVRTVIARHTGGRCVFLEPQPGGRVFFCRIQPFKPAACIDWQADLAKGDCQAGLERYWQLGVDAESRLTGTAKDLAEFKNLLKNLAGGATQAGRD